MRDGRRQRLGLAEGTEGTVQDTYLDRILEEEGPRTLALGDNAFVDTRDQRYVGDAYKFYLDGGFPEEEVEAPVVAPDFTGGQMIDTGGEGGGQDLATSGVDLGNNAGVTAGPSGFIGLDPNMDINTQDITDYGTYDPPSLGEVTADNYGTETDLGEVTADNYGTETDLGEVTADNYDTPKTFDDQYQSIEDIPVGTGINYSEFDDLEADAGAQPTFAAEDVDAQGNLLQSGIDKMKSIFPNFNPIVAAGKIAFNSYIGAPVTLAFDALKAIGGMLPEDSQENINARNITAELVAEGAGGGYNMQSGNIGQDPFGRNPVSALGDYDALMEKDLAYTGTNKIDLAKKKYAEQYIDKKEKKELVQTYDIEGTDEGDRADKERDTAIDTGIQAADDDSGSEMLDTTPQSESTTMSDISLADMPRQEFEDLINNVDDFSKSIDLVESRTRGQEYLDDLEEIGTDADYIGYTEQEKADIATGRKKPQLGELVDFAIDTTIGLPEGTTGGFGGYEKGAFADDATGSDTSPGATGGEGGFDDNSFSDANTGFDTSPGATGGEGGGGDGCFLAGTLVTMADGTTKPVEQVDLKDNVAEGGKVFATGKFLVENLHDYKGIKVSGSHMVNEDGNWVIVEDSKHGKPLGEDEHTVYVFGSENRRILINGILFTDYFEITDQEKLLKHKDKFFDNWQTYAKNEDINNVDELNAN